ncbi:hypothetical protein BH09ACT5_BH09ACT5_24700 [soil metagenome]
MEAATMPLPIITLQQLGDPTAAACEGDFCAIPDHHEQAVVNRKLDSDNI